MSKFIVIRSYGNNKKEVVGVFGENELENAREYVVEHEEFSYLTSFEGTYKILKVEEVH